MILENMIVILLLNITMTTLQKSHLHLFFCWNFSLLTTLSVQFVNHQNQVRSDKETIWLVECCDSCRAGQLSEPEHKSQHLEFRNLFLLDFQAVLALLTTQTLLQLWWHILLYCAALKTQCLFLGLFSL